MGNYSEFQRAVKLVIDNVSFEKCSTVQVFEANIRWARYVCDNVLYLPNKKLCDICILLEFWVHYWVLIC